MEERLKSDLNQALKSGNQSVVATLRLVLSELIYLKKQKGESLSDEDILGVVSREYKKRQESIDAFSKANRIDLVDKESAEAEVLKVYLPEPMSDLALTNLVKDTITELGVTSPAEMGKVIGAVKAKVGQTADGGRISQIVRSELSGSI